MSELPPADAIAVAQRRQLRLYTAVAALMIVGILGLVGYSILLGPLVGPGVEESFGLALATMFLMSAVLAHVVDRIYRAYPFGRRVAPAALAPLTADAWVTFAKVVIVAAAGVALAYVLGGLIAS
ncbi:MAG TPA: hypothetical protein VFF67_05220 [Thermoplasmata archaeon]|nr:hypothetical protein [Thermoplasmata archaeon]